MGVSRRVDCPRGVPPWPDVLSRLSAEGVAVEMRMIDGQLAFPDEEPSEHWQELRVSLGGWMVTIRRDGSTVELISWADPPVEMHRAVSVLERVLAG